MSSTFRVENLQETEKTPKDKLKSARGVIIYYSYGMVHDEQLSHGTRWITPFLPGIKRKRGGVEPIESSKRRVRTVYTKEELKQLESIFTLQTQYPDLLMRKQIAERFGITERKIHVSRILSISSVSVFQVAYFMLNKIYPFPPSRTGFRTEERSKGSSSLQ